MFIYFFYWNCLHKEITRDHCDVEANADTDNPQEKKDSDSNVLANIDLNA